MHNIDKALYAVYNRNVIGYFRHNITGMGGTKMIIKPFNFVYIMMWAVTLTVVVLVWALTRNCGEKKKKKILIGMSIANIILFFVYKLLMSVDPGFAEASGIDKFNWFNELPLQLCNINMFLIPLGLLTKKRSILGFSFFLAPLGAAMALLFPDLAFVGYSILLPRIIGFYLTHMMIFICGISLATMGFYRPVPHDIPGISATVIIIAACAFGIDIILRSTVCSFANYFFVCDPAGISLLSLFWSWIPIPFVYELPAIGIFVVYAAIVCIIFRFIGKKGEAEKASE